MRHRLTVYRNQTRPLVDYYSSWAVADQQAPRYRKVEGVGSVEDIRNKVFQALA